MLKRNQTDSLAPLQIADLVKRMEGRTTTNNWDVVANYDVESLNEILKNEFKQSHILDKTITYTQKMLPYFSVITTFNLKFSNPYLAFTPDINAYCDVFLPIESDSTYDQVTKVGQMNTSVPPTKGNLPKGLVLKVKVPLKHVLGQAKNSSKAVDGGELITMEPGDKASTLLRFTEGLEVSISEGNNALDDLYLTVPLKYAFSKNIKEIDYYLFDVLSTPKLKNSSIALTPKSFIITTIGNKDNGVLSVWIQTQETGNSPGDSNAYFKPGKDDPIETSPLPATYNSSVIFSENTIKWYISQLMKDFTINKSKLNIDNEYVDKGTVFTAQNTPYVLSMSYYRPLPDKDVAGSEKMTCNEMSIGYSAPHLLYISLVDQTFKLQWDWSQDFTCNYTRETYVTSIFGIAHEHDTWTGHFTMNASMQKSVDLTLANDQDFIFNISVAKDDFKISQTNISVNENKFMQKFTRDGSILKQTSDVAYKFIEDNKPSLNLDLQALNFFAEANILFNQKRFTADKKVGINTPADLMIVGNIA